MKLLSRITKQMLFVIWVSLLTITTTALLVEGAIHKLLDTYHIKMEGNPSLVSLVWQQMWGQQNLVDNKAETCITEQKSSLPTSSHVLHDEPISAEKLDQVKSGINTEDKEKLIHMVMSKVPQTEMQEISRLLEDGLTENKMKKIKEIVSKYVDQEEYEEVLELLKKYFY